MQQDLTKGNLFRQMLRFSIPYLIASFLQTFYGLADLYVIGRFDAAEVQTAVSIGSQVTHMLTVVIVGLAMGTTVLIGYAIGAKDQNSVRKTIGNSIVVFVILSVLVTIGLLLSMNGLLQVLHTPKEAYTSAQDYLKVCFIGVPFIIAYNVVSSIYRGLGDTRTPMYFVALAGVINIGLDFLLIGSFSMGAKGAAVATVIAQAISVILAALVLIRKRFVTLSASDFSPEKQMIQKILRIGGPIALQEGLIQVSFLVITAVANSRGYLIADAVGIVEKIITFLFLVPSSMLATVSAMAAQNAGANLHERGRKALGYGIIICLVFGAFVIAIVEFTAEGWIRIFQKEEMEIVRLGAQYLRAYIIDVALASVHFCFSGFFNAYRKSIYTFLQNMTSVVLIRIPLVFLFTALYPDNLFPMGMAAPLGSFYSIVVCVILYQRGKKKGIFTA